MRGRKSKLVVDRYIVQCRHNSVTKQKKSATFSFVVILLLFPVAEMYFFRCANSLDVTYFVTFAQETFEVM